MSYTAGTIARGWKVEIYEETNRSGKPILGFIATAPDGSRYGRGLVYEGPGELDYVQELLAANIEETMQKVEAFHIRETVMALEVCDFCDRVSKCECRRMKNICAACRDGGRDEDKREFLEKTQTRAPG